ncbi:hypothetical protein AKJ64_04680 [candidate division MSBL1 archaeon SCGC-AAA259E17]|uniref:HEPN domain-containing protein n=1 Tax=candidate division MSBL1 archaeon SCGC-AAA259E17 TaxID=1698263 RepID=A0A133UBH2_9EURY|nr:hypothetical protein AKJ64_04680 [candidate division MSBL1 archaeon SCGC-AAA259E17]
MGSSSEKREKLVNAYLERAEKALDASETLFDSDFYSECISQAYYSAYYAARACLLLEQVSPKTHSGTVAKFGELFVKTGRTEQRAGRVLNELEEDRQKADYQITIDVGREEARDAIEDGEYFLDKACEICGKELGEAAVRG